MNFYGNGEGRDDSTRPDYRCRMANIVGSSSNADLHPRPQLMPELRFACFYRTATGNRPGKT
jgi:hypothetical protein